MELIGGTPGIGFIVARAWNFFLSASTLGPLCRFILHQTKLSDLAEIVDGAGGSMADLASIVATYITAVVPSRDTDVCGPHDWLLQGVLPFIIAFDGMDKPPRVAPTGHHELGPLCTALVQHRIVKALTLVACAFSKVTIYAATFTLTQCFKIL
ncbi:hypothetical protein FB451DRAFT_1395086 [Mycena latifolia]|nr:hypothetical protein FB451DRAFT_1395086 [Mycena latifolia]